MSTPATIRPLAAPDRQAWQDLFAAYGVFYQSHFTPAVFDGVWAWLMDAAHPVTALVAEVMAAEGPRLVGFAHLRRVDDTFTAGPSWFLDDLYTAPEYRGHGVARALIERCETTAGAAGGGTLRWITAADNIVAQALYDKVATRTTWITYEKET